MMAISLLLISTLGHSAELQGTITIERLMDNNLLPFDEKSGGFTLPTIKGFDGGGRLIFVHIGRIKDSFQLPEPTTAIAADSSFSLSGELKLAGVQRQQVNAPAILMYVSKSMCSVCNEVTSDARKHLKKTGWAGADIVLVNVD
ncbi:MAG: hypothetical protein ACK4E7_02875 [Permianibacter sp.]